MYVKYKCNFNYSSSEYCRVAHLLLADLRGGAVHLGHRLPVPVPGHFSSRYTDRRTEMSIKYKITTEKT